MPQVAQAYPQTYIGPGDVKQVESASFDACSLNMGAPAWHGRALEAFRRTELDFFESSTGHRTKL